MSDALDSGGEWSEYTPASSPMFGFKQKCPMCKDEVTSGNFQRIAGGTLPECPICMEETAEIVGLPCTCKTSICPCCAERCEIEIVKEQKHIASRPELQPWETSSREWVVRDGKEVCSRIYNQDTKRWVDYNGATGKTVRLLEKKEWDNAQALVRAQAQAPAPQAQPQVQAQAQVQAQPIAQGRRSPSPQAARGQPCASYLPVPVSPGPSFPPAAQGPRPSSPPAAGGPRPSQNLFLGTGAPSNHFWDAAQQEAEDDVDSKCYAYEGNPTSRNHVFQQPTSLKDNYNTWEPTIYDNSEGSEHYVGHRNLYVSLPMEEQLENARIFFASDAANEINEVWKKSNGQMTQEMRVAMSEVRQLLADNGTTYDAYIAVLREKVKKPGGRHKKGNLKAADFLSHKRRRLQQESQSLSA